MKQFEWRTSEKLNANNDSDYINDCCEFGDTVLERIRSGLEKVPDLNASSASIMQEDWGWLLELTNGDILYEIDINYNGLDGEKAHTFNTVIQAIRIKKGFLFSRKTEAEEECAKFAELVNQIAIENNFEVKMA